MLKKCWSGVAALVFFGSCSTAGALIISDYKKDVVVNDGETWRQLWGKTQFFLNDSGKVKEKLDELRVKEIEVRKIPEEFKRAYWFSKVPTEVEYTAQIYKLACLKYYFLNGEKTKGISLEEYRKWCI